MTETVQISAQTVNDLRTQTGAGLMDCKRALVETAGNVEKAIDFLRAKGLASAAKKADRIAKDGLVAAYISADGKSGALVQVSCETDFVAKTDMFKEFAKALAEHVAANKPSDVEVLNAQTMKSTGASVKDSVTSLITKLGEKMEVRTFAVSEGGLVEQYIHLGGKVGVLLSLNTTAGAKAEVKQLAKDICMHIAASSPTALSRDEVPAELVAREKEIAAEQAKGKPAPVVEKMVTGKLEKFYAQSVLLEQPFVKNPDMTVKALVESVSKQAGDAISIKAFSRLQVGA